MSDKNPFSGLLSALGLSGDTEVRVGTPEELLATLKSALPPSIVKQAEELADRILGDMPQEIRDYKDRVSDLHNQFHEVGAEGEQTYAVRPATVNAIMFDGENIGDVTEFMRKHSIDYGVSNNQILVDMKRGTDGLEILESGTFIVVRNVTEDNPIPAFTFMGCMQFMMGYELPVSVQRQEQADKDFEDDALTEREQELDQEADDAEVDETEDGRLKAWNEQTQAEESDRDSYGRAPGQDHYGHFHG